MRCGISAAFAVDTASCALGTIVDNHLICTEHHTPIFHHKAWNTDRAMGFYRIEGRMTVAQVQKGLEVSHMLANVDELILGVAAQLLFHLSAIGTGVHYKYLDHSGVN